MAAWAVCRCQTPRRSSGVHHLVRRVNGLYLEWHASSANRPAHCAVQRSHGNVPQACWLVHGAWPRPCPASAAATTRGAMTRRCDACDDDKSKKKPRELSRGLEAQGPAVGIYMPMPPIPPMPPMSGMPPAGASSLGASETMHSVVSIRLATDAAFCSAVRVTLVGSRIPISIMSP